jgi:putative ABC transport system permease protein
VLNDLRLAGRGLLKSPGFTSVAILTLALGIGASTAIFSVVNGVLLRSLPYPNPDGLMQVETVFQSGRAGRVSYPNFEDLREQSQSFEELAAYEDWTTSVVSAGQGFRLRQAQVSAGFFSVLGVAPAVGRALSADEHRTGQHVAVVSYGYWHSRLGGNENLPGLSVRVGDQIYGVIGVMPRNYDFPVGTELWVPREPATESRSANNWSIVGRLRDGVSRGRAQQDLSTIAQRLRQQYGDETSMADAAVRPVLEQLVGNARPALLVLLAAAGVLLLVACVNVANLSLARALSRDRDSAVRLALGARPARLARRFLAESLLMSLSGAALGVLLALAGVPALLALEPGRLPRVQNVSVDWPVLAFTLTVSVLSAVIVGLVPAIRAARRDTREALVGSHRIQGGSLTSHRLRGILVVTQIALTTVLLVCAGLLGRSFLNLLAVDPGFRTQGAIVMDVWFPEPCRYSALGATCDSAAEMRIVDFIERLTAGLRATPGVEQVGGVNDFPLEGGGANGTFVIQQRVGEVSSFEDRLWHEPARTGNAEFRVASADYFGAMGIPLIRGRRFDERDTGEAPHVALISASLAETRWPGEDPVGKLIQFGNMDGDFQALTVIGVVGDVQEYGIGVQPRPTLYVDYRQRPRKASTFHVAIQGAFDVAAVTASARRLAHERDPEVPIGFRPLREVASEALADRRFVAFLLTVFGGLALVLATTGVYGVVAYTALQRTPEMGVRVALGARGRDVMGLFLRQGAALALAGIAIGLLACFALTRLVVSFLYDVGAADPVTFITTAAALFVAAVVAGGIPAYRAARVDPVEVLRHQ